MRYLHERRKDLGGSLPSRKPDFEALAIPGVDSLESVTKGTGEREISTTMALVRVLSALIKDKEIGKRVVPTVPHEARAFGMKVCFPSQESIHPPDSYMSLQIVVR